MIEVYFRCGACGNMIARKWLDIVERVHLATSRNEGAERIAMVCETCEGDHETARARLLNPEPGMPIGSMEFTVGQLRHLILVCETAMSRDRLLAEEAQEEAEKRRGVVHSENLIVTEEARNRVRLLEGILAVVKPALASVEGRAQTLGVQITDRINALIEQEGLQLVPESR